MQSDVYLPKIIALCAPIVEYKAQPDKTMYWLLLVSYVIFIE